MDLPLTNPLASPGATLPNLVPGKDPDQMRQAATDFEAAFIAQMLSQSGLADSLTSGDGHMASAFGSFFIEELATEMAANGGIGLADSIYKQLAQYDRGEPT